MVVGQCRGCDRSGCFHPKLLHEPAVIGEQDRVDGSLKGLDRARNGVRGNLGTIAPGIDGVQLHGHSVPNDDGLTFRESLDLHALFIGGLRRWSSQGCPAPGLASPPGLL